MTPEELTQLASVHQAILTRHDQEMAEIRAALRQASIQHSQEMDEIRSIQAATQAKIDANAEQIALFTAGLVELRNLVTDYLRGRSQFSENS